MKKAFLPSSVVKIQKIVQSPLTSQFVFEHLESGLAVSWGNFFRRILLTQVPGWAIFALKISDQEKTIASEFEKLKGVSEIPLYLILNLKKLVFQAKKPSASQEKIVTLELNVDNSGSQENYLVTGQDLQGDLNLVNPTTHLATLEAKSQLKITLYCRYYWGSTLAKEQKNLLLPKEKKVIFLPSDYCPVKNVSWKVDNVVVSLDKEEEKLTLGITTDGSITPEESLLKVIDFLDDSLVNFRQLITQVS